MSNTAKYLLACLLWLPLALVAQNVGIDNSAPPAPLSFATFGFGNKMLFSGNGQQPHIGIGMQNNRVQFYTANPPDHIRLGIGNSSNFTDLLLIRANGYVGINQVTSPWHPLEVKGNISFTSLYLDKYLNKTGISNGIYMNESSNQVPVAFMGIMGYLNSYSLIEGRGVGIASLQPQPNMLFAVQMDHGGLILEKRPGITGEVMRSGGPAAPAFWSSAPDIELYDKLSTACDNLIYELSNTSPTLTLQNLNYQPTLDRIAKILFQTNIKMYTTACTLCSSSVVDMKILQNGAVVRTYRYSISNGSPRILNTATMLDLLPGTPTISVQLQWISGPNITVSSDYNCRSVKYIPEM